MPILVVADPEKIATRYWPAYIPSTQMLVATRLRFNPAPTRHFPISTFMSTPSEAYTASTTVFHLAVALQPVDIQKIRIIMET